MLESHGGQLYKDNITRTKLILLKGQYSLGRITSKGYRLIDLGIGNLNSRGIFWHFLVLFFQLITRLWISNVYVMQIFDRLERPC